MSLIKQAYSGTSPGSAAARAELKVAGAIILKFDCGAGDLDVLAITRPLQIRHACSFQELATCGGPPSRHRLNEDTKEDFVLLRAMHLAELHPVGVVHVLRLQRTRRTAGIWKDLGVGTDTIKIPLSAS